MDFWAMHHQCACCEYWAGERKVKHDPRLVEADYNSRGLCTSPSNKARRGQQMAPGIHAGGLCFVCWRCLKEK